MELLGAKAGHSFFLTADAIHLLAHIGIFLVLLLRPGGRHASREDVTTLAVVALVLLIALGLAFESLRGLLEGGEAVKPMAMLLSLLGLGANLVTAWLFRDPARSRWSFRAALAHELADASLTIAGLLGAGAIALFQWRWVDPGLSLAIAAWLLVWCGRLIVRRIRMGEAAWTTADEAGH